MQLNLPSPIENIQHPLFEKYGLEVWMKRDDLIHPEISGNKWRKLKLNIEKFKSYKYDKILTFGGAYSNHIAATACIGSEMGIPTIGMIRGEELSKNSNETLEQAAQYGMQLEFVSRSEYQYRYEKWHWENLRSKYGNCLIIPEGGANILGVLGCAEIVSELDFEPDYIFCAAGTGTTISGLLLNVLKTIVVAVPVFKNGHFIKDEVKTLLSEVGLLEDDLNDKMNQLELATDYHFGGYGKYNEELISFMNVFYNQTKIKLDQIYTGKMVYAFFEMIKAGKFKPGSKIVLLHTGGIQGISSIKDKLIY